MPFFLFILLCDTLYSESRVIGPSNVPLDSKLGIMGDLSDMPPEEEVLALFVELLDEFGLPGTKREQMMAMPTDRKWMLIQQQRGRDRQHQVRDA